MPTTFKLPKVTEYVKNVGKSITFASIDTVKENSPGIKDFLDTNDDIFKEVYSSVKNYRATIRKAEKSAKQSNVYKAVEYGIKNMIEDAKTGKFYNDRSKDIGEHAFGFDEFEDDDNDYYYESSSDSNSDSVSIADSVNDAIGAAATSQATIVAQSTDIMVQSNKASTKLIMAHMDRTGASLSSSIGTVYSAISVTNAFLNGPMKAHLENSKRFYEENLKTTNEINSMLKELLEMQRNLYKAEGSKQKESRLDQSMGIDGSANIKEYMKNIKSNITNMADSWGLGMLNMDMGGGNPYLMAMTSPIQQIIIGPLINQMMSKDFKKALSSFDKGVTTMFSQFISRMNTAKKEGNGFMSILGQIFGIDVNVKDNINTGNYKKDAVPFDGITRQSIIETIPGYLARIEAALTGTGERHYDFQSGSWKSAKQIEKEFDEHKKRAVSIANFDGILEFEEMLSKLESQGEKGSKERKDAEKRAASLRKQGMNAFTKIFDMGGDFRPNGIKDEFGNFTEGWKLLGFKSEKDFNMWYKSLSRDTQRSFAKENLSGRESLSKKIAYEEANGGTGRQLFNGAYDMTGTGNGKRNNPSKFKGGGNGLLAFSTDNSGHNVFWYLNEILNTIGNYRGRKRKSKSKNNSSYSSNNHNSNNRSNNGESSSSDSDSDSDPDPDPDLDEDDDVYQKYIEEEQKRRDEDRQKSGKKLGDWVNKKFGDSKIGKSLSKILGNAEDVLSKPMSYMTKLLNKADESMFKLMFGDKDFKDKNGNKYNNIFDFITDKVESTFEDIKNKIKKGLNKVFNPIKDWAKEKLTPLWEKYGKPVVGEIKNIGKKGADRVKGTFNRFKGDFENAKTYVHRYREASDFASAASEATGQKQYEIQKAIASRSMNGKEWKKNNSAIRKKAYDDKMNAIKKASEGEVASADEVAGTATDNDKKDPGIKIVESAYGRYVTKRGLTMISPGEMIIPASFDKREQNKMLALEKRDRSRIYDSISLNAAGTFNTNELKDNLKKIYDENKGNGAKNAASGIMGAGAGALLMGNPLLGALAGAGLSILGNSETFKTAIFGKETEDGEREGGLVPKKIQSYFKKALPDMGDFGIAGGLAGLFTPFGPLGGAVIGAGIGMLKNSEGFKKFIFGDAETGKDGLISKETAEKAKSFLTKSVPKVAIGAVAGALAGPFGLIGNAALGAGAGLVASTDTFHNILFGNPDDKDSTGGILGAFKRGILDPAKEKIGEILESFKGYAKKHILDPLKNFWEPFQQSIKNTITNVGDKVKDHINDMFEKKVGLPINDFLQEKLFKPMTKLVFGILKAPIAMGKAIVSAPFKLLGSIGNSTRMSQIRKGTAYDMSASERLDWRDQHKGRAKFRSLFGKDKMLEQDQMLAGMTEEQLNEIATNSRAGLDSMATLQKSKGKATEAVNKEFSKFFNEKIDDKSSKIRYDKVNIKKVNKLLKNIEEKGDVDFARQEIYKIKGLTDEEKEKLFNSVSDKIAEVGRTSAAYDAAKDSNKDVDAELSKLLGRKIKSRKDKRKIYRNAEAELKARKAANAEKDSEEDKKEENQETEAVDSFKSLYEERTDQLINILKEANISLKKISDPDYSEEKDAKLRKQAESAEKAGYGNADEIYSKLVNRNMTKEEYRSFYKAVMQGEKMNLASEQAQTPTAAQSAVSEVVGTANIDASAPDIISSISNNNSILDKIKNSKFNIFGKKKVSEDSKEAVDAKKDAAEDEKDERTANAAMRETAENTKTLTETMIGTEDERKKNKDGGGLLSKIGGAIGSVFQFLGGPVGTIAKTGLKVVGIAGGVSLLGYASKWIKDSFWPKLKEVLFGSDDGDSSGETTNTGLVGKLKTKFKEVMFGDPDDPNDGLWGNLKQTSIGKFFTRVGEFFDKVKEKGGFKQYFAEELMPKIIDKFTVGWGYAMENIVTPLTALVVKKLPSILASLASALVNGIKSAILKKEITRDGDSGDSITVDTTDIGSMHTSTNSNLGNMVSDTVKKHYSSTSAEIGGSSSSAVNWVNYFDSNYASSDKTYDSNGNKTGKTSDEIMYEKAGGLSGVLGAKQSTNKLYYDENGNIALDSYDQMNTVDSIGSRVVDAAGSGLVRGVAGSTGIIGKLLSKLSGKGFGKSYAKLATGALNSGLKGTGNVLNAGNNLGLKINKFMSNGIATNTTNKITQQYIDDLVAAGVGSVDDITKLVTEKGVKGAAKELTNTLKNTSAWTNDVRHVVLSGAKKANLGIKSANEFYGVADDVAANTADDSVGVVGKLFNKVKTKISKKSAEKAGVTAANAADNVIDDATAAAAKTTTKAAEAVGKVASSGTKAGGLAAKIASIFTSLADSKIGGFLLKACSAGTTKATLSAALKKLGDRLATNVVGKVAQKGLNVIANAVGKFSPLTMAIWVKDFIHGYDQADTLLGVAKGSEYQVGIGQKCLCGLLNLINNQLTFGLIPTETIIDIIVEFLFPLFGLSADELNAARDEADNVMDEWNKAHPEETYTNLEDFNNKDKWWYKAKTAVGDKMSEIWGKTKESAKETWGKVKEGASNAWGKVKEGASNAWDKTKEFGSKAVTFVKDGFSAIGDKVTETWGKVTDVGKFIKDIVANTLKSSTDPDYEWDINSYISEDDPLGGVKKTIYTVMKVPLTVVGLVGRVGKKVFDGIKGFVGDIKDGIKDAWKDISGVAKGEYTVFSKEYWKFNDEGNSENPLSVVSKISSTLLKIMTIPQSMLGWVGSKVWSGIKTLVSGAKEGTMDAKSDVDAVKSGQYTIFNKDYWKTDNADEDNQLSLLGNIFGVISRVFQAPMAMLGWTGTKVKEIFTKVINGAKEGSLDASKDVDAVKSGRYTVFSKEYWTSDTDSDNPLSKLASVFGFVTRIAQAPMAMLGWTGTKVKEVFTNIANNAKEGSLDASKDVDAVKSGRYTVFSKEYWTSEDDGDNPLSKLGSVFGFVTRIAQAPMAMLGWTGTKVKEVFTNIVSGAKEGSLDASKDIDAVKKGEYSIFDKKYWASEDDEDNPLSKLGSVFGFVNKLTQAPAAMLGYTLTKVKSTFESMVDGVKDIQSETDKVVKEVENGSISVFSKSYWTINVDENNPLGVLGKVMGFVERLIKAPMLLIKGLLNKIGNGFLDWLGLDDLNELTGGSLDSGSGRSARGRNKKLLFGRGHVYQSDSIISNMKYGDSTIGESGCAPVAATNLINNINPNTMNVQEAAAFAEKNGLTVRGGGTDIRYFNKFLGSQGISTSNTNNKDTILSALKNGNQVIMLGRDSNNADGAPFGTNPHFITATGIDDNGNIIVQDPDLPQSSVTYSKNNLFKSMISSIVTNGSQIKSKRGSLHGLGKRLWGGSGDDSSEVSVSNLMSQLGSIGTNILKSKYGDLYSALYGDDEENSDSSSDTMSTEGTTSSGSVNLTGSSDGQKIWNFLRDKGYTPAGTAGIMGNLYAESGLDPRNIQNSYESKYGSDADYTNAVDTKKRGKEAFSNDSAGYGLAQWTYHTLKRGLYEATVEKGKSIGDLAGQLSYLDQEFKTDFKGLYNTLTSTTSINTAADKMLKEFERPAVLNYNDRRRYANNMYSKYSGSGRANTGSATAALNNSYGRASYNEYYGRARVPESSSTSVDYVTFLQTIVALLTNISTNTALLSKILEILSKYFDINISKSEIEAAANAATQEQARSTLSNLIKNNGGDSSKVSKLLNNQDTDYIFKAMASIAQE